MCVCMSVWARRKQKGKYCGKKEKLKRENEIDLKKRKKERKRERYYVYLYGCLSLKKR